MSLSKYQENGAAHVPRSKISQVFQAQFIKLTLDRHCVNCSEVVKGLALEGCVGKTCMRCGSEFSFRNESDGTYRRCVRCCVFIKCNLDDIILKCYNR